MTFELDHVSDFLSVFHSKKEHIRAFSGCSHLELLKDVEQEHIYFTYSYWYSQNDLDNYRHSELFKETWAATKVLFSAKPEAWSLNREVALT